jgi:lyso-ornithine lipid O-acyltransferase
MRGAPRAAPRLLLYGLWTLALLPVQAAALLMSMGLAERLPLLYHRGVCRILGLTVERRGVMSATRPTLFVCNHTSYIDIEALGAVVPGCFVAKSEVAGWPGFGLLAKLQRTIFVERRAQRTAGQRDVMAERLAAGDNLMLFAEGTSNDGNRVLPFKSALFSVTEQPINGAPVTVQPVSIAYTRLGGMPLMRHMRPLFAWYGDMELAGHLWTLMGTGDITVAIEFHAPVTIDQFGSRKALAGHCHQVIAHGVSAAIHGTRQTNT